MDENIENIENIEKEEKLMKIGDIAAFFGVSVKAVRIYEKKGILIPAKVDPETGYRYYTAGQVQILNTLLELKAIGFSLDEIKDIMSGKVDNDRFAAALKHKRIAWQETISAARNKIRAIDKISGNMLNSEENEKDSKKLYEFTKLTDEERAWRLIKMVCAEDLSGWRILSEALWL